MSRQTSIPIEEESRIGEARRLAVRCAELAGFPETESGKVAIIASELAANLVRHALKGELLLQVLRTGNDASIELISIDSGPGIPDVDRCLQDGYSTAGTNGIGLGAIKRLSSEFDIHSAPKKGTVILSRVGSQKHCPADKNSYVIGGACIAMHGETACGDLWQALEADRTVRVMVADGLGHGPLAEHAAVTANNVFTANPSNDPGLLLDAAHRNLTGTRGAAIAIACLNIEQGELKYAGVGNIAGSLLTSGGHQGLVSHNGIIGGQKPKIQQFEYSFQGSGLLIMHSDGLKTHWSLDDYPGLAVRHPAIIAAVLYRDYRRGRDDTTVVVIKFK